MVGQSGGEQRSEGQIQGKPDLGTVRWEETQYVGYTGDDRTVYTGYLQALTANQCVGCTR